MPSTYQVYRVADGDMQKGIMRCCLTFMEHYNILPEEIKIHESYRDVGLFIPEELGTTDIIFDQSVLRGEMWIGPVPI